MLGRSGMNRIIAVLVVLLMGSSWQIIVHQHEIRKLNIDLEKEKSRYNDLKLEYQRLELQNSKDTATDHIESIAREKEEAEAAKKAAKNPIAKPVVLPQVAGTSKEETKKEEVKPVPAKVETAKKEVKVEDKSTNKPEVKLVAKIEPKPIPKVETPKPVIKPAPKKVDPMEDQLGEFIKKHESKSKN